ncbi:MAG: family 10 glycosylhydrolase [Verrucomicrobiales bacterium]|nr:family 10 glycosylhydrolase [Verrucomicrobiales bacterium]
MKTTALSLIIFLVVSRIAVAADYVPTKTRAPEPAREFRGAWVATVHNIDWPSRQSLTASQQKAEMVELLDSAASVGINAIVFQVRTECDALYKSQIEPWSYWLTGSQGKDPGYDPLQFTIEECHKRGMELHAWFNPFRSSSSSKSVKRSNHISKTHSGEMLSAGTQVWANPASDYVRNRAISVMVDVVKRYDVDGIHMDDYFYPYPRSVGGKMVDQFDDSRSYKAYRSKGGRLGLRDWRRSNIDGFVQQLYTSIKSTRKTVKFGISPFGIWRPGVPNTIQASLDSYDHISADSRKWLRSGWVDYLSPQLYWRIDDKPHSFMTLAKWWSGENVQNRHLWPGVASARILSSDDRGRPATESIRQIDITRSVAANRMGSGHIHWNYSAIGNDRGGVRKLLGQAYAETPIIPASPWLGSSAPSDLWAAPKIEGNSVVLHFRASPDARWRLVQIREKPNQRWTTLRMIPASQPAMRLNALPYEIAMRNISPTGILSEQTVVQLK